MACCTARFALCARLPCAPALLPRPLPPVRTPRLAPPTPAAPPQCNQRLLNGTGRDRLDLPLKMVVQEFGAGGWWWWRPGGGGGGGVVYHKCPKHQHQYAPITPSLHRPAGPAVMEELSERIGASVVALRQRVEELLHGGGAPPAPASWTERSRCVWLGGGSPAPGHPACMHWRPQAVGCFRRRSCTPHCAPPNPSPAAAAAAASPRSTTLCSPTGAAAAVPLAARCMRVRSRHCLALVRAAVRARSHRS